MYEIGNITGYVSGAQARGAIHFLQCLTDEVRKFQQVGRQYPCFLGEHVPVAHPALVPAADRQRGLGILGRLDYV